MAESKSPSTVRAYTSDWRRFDTWCARREHRELPADPLVIAAYLTDAADTLTDTGARAYAPATLAVDGRDRPPPPDGRIPATDNGSDRHRDPVRDPPKLCRGR
ncbi:hypothetical protein GCM10020255_003890 [Rhodococcus baikonurensis]